jgi:hypothetical protein
MINMKKKEIQKEIQLEIPPELAHLDNFHAVRMTHDFLQFRTGLYENCLAIYIPGNAEKLKGDLAAISINSDNEVKVGFVSSDLGLVALEQPFYDLGYFETNLYEENEVEILGKIVGYCEPPEKKGDKYQVKPIEIKPERTDRDN